MLLQGVCVCVCVCPGYHTAIPLRLVTYTDHHRYTTYHLCHTLYLLHLLPSLPPINTGTLGPFTSLHNNTTLTYHYQQIISTATQMTATATATPTYPSTRDMRQSDLFLSTTDSLHDTHDTTLFHTPLPPLPLV